MFFSKIWFFVIAVIAAAALAVALLLPRPAQRRGELEEQRRLVVACGVVKIVLEDYARKQVDLAGLFARTPSIEAELAAASSASSFDDGRMKQARSTGLRVIEDVKGDRKPDLAILIDKKGRVVARVFVDEGDYGDVVAGRPLVDDALAGYLRDDLWMIGNTMYFMSASPVIKDGDYVGAVVLGQKVTNDLAKQLLSKSLLVDLGFYRGTDTVAATQMLAFDQKEMAGGVGRLQGELKTDCSGDNAPIELQAGNTHYRALVARLPGEAGARGAYFAVFAERPAARGFMATLDEVNKQDLGFGNFPWVLVVGGFVVALGVGIALMMFEADRPLRRLAADTVRLAKGDAERLSEDAHPGKFGSIARSVNIHIDKLGREAKSAKKDLDQLLGPAPEGSLGTIDLLATALPAIRPGGPAPAAPPPPSEFKFGETTPPPRPSSPPARTPPVRAPTPPPMPVVGRAAPPPPVSPPAAAATTTDKLALDDDILGAPTVIGGPDALDPYFKQIFDEFVALKQQCHESTSGLSYEKFSEKLIRNRDELKARTGCREVRFTVYVKEGKAALKATPVKDE